MVDTPHAAVRDAHPDHGHRGTGRLPAYAIGRRLPVSPGIFEILQCILVGQDVLGWAGDGRVTGILKGRVAGEGVGTGSESW